jgi:tRNA A-37 threonylcarbamoyl transferase component Bud32
MLDPIVSAAAVAESQIETGLLAPGQVYGGKYRIKRELGSGSMGAVYEAENVLIHRRVAIKALHPGIAARKDIVDRFEREAQAAGRIGSDHIVEVVDLGELPDGTRYLVMEYLDGTTLEGRVRAKGRLAAPEAAGYVAQLLEGLEAAHAAGIIHRDLKPANVWLCPQKSGPEYVKILDFGVSKFSALNTEEMSMTRTGMVLGTPYYMSPEQAKGNKDMDHRSDLYSVGVILYECITGQLPFAAETFNELLFRIVLESPPPAETYVPDLDPEFAAIIRKAMHREPEGRFASASEFRQALEGWLARQVSGGLGAHTMVMNPELADGGATLMFAGRAPGPLPPRAEPAPALAGSAASSASALSAPGQGVLYASAAAAPPAVAANGGASPPLGGAYDLGTTAARAPVRRSNALPLAVFGLAMVAGVGIGALVFYRRLTSPAAAATTTSTEQAGASAGGASEAPKTQATAPAATSASAAAEVTPKPTDTAAPVAAAEPDLDLDKPTDKQTDKHATDKQTDKQTDKHATDKPVGGVAKPKPSATSAAKPATTTAAPTAAPSTPPPTATATSTAKTPGRTVASDL